MSSFIVSYELNSEQSDCTELHNRIKSYIAYYHCLNCTWIIKSEFSVEQIREHLLAALHKNDRLLVAKIQA
ncbi:hypothetical protein [Planctobacterium marinum]|uniref:hypothetical protein n=1 Tax=Planctobacterium marinum TaxID=1631968 RepID=UPI001E3B4FF8|nr:hypothetical protein [Planctobacterium marinum]MCC2605702.1 hypothetical protein [Planctobacterium marinum]